MPTFRSSRRIGAWWVLGLVPVAILACEVGDAVKDVTGPHPMLNFPTALGDPSVFPTGSGASTDILIAGFDTSAVDAFDRATGDFPQWFAGCCFFFVGWERNGSQDARLPALVDADAFADGDLENFDPAAWELFVDPPEQVHDWFMIFANLAAEQVYVTGLVRYGLEVRGALDASQVLLGEPVDQPDSLFPLGGSPGGDATRRADLFNCTLCGSPGDPYPWEPMANPFIFGYAESETNGSLTFDAVISACTEVGEEGDEDACVSSTPVTYTNEATRMQSNSPVAPNSFTTFDFPNYNYLVVWEADFQRDPVTDEIIPTSVTPRFDRPVVRVQMGTDLAADGTPINNGLAPFPTGQIDPNTASTLPGGANAGAAPGGLSLSFTNLPPLTGALYKAFLVRSSDGAVVDGTGEHAVDAGTPAVEAAFNSPSDEAVHTLTIDGVSAGVAPGDYNRLVISIETTAGAATPTNPFFIFDYLDGGTDPVSRGDDAITLSEGLALTRETPAGTKETFGLTGTGLAQIIYEDSLIVSLRRLAQPVPGWAYKAFLIEETGAGVLQEEFAGVVDLDPDGNADFRIGASALGGLGSFNKFVVTLQPSIGDPGTLMKYRVHASDDYRAKFADFFSP